MAIDKSSKSLFRHLGCLIKYWDKHKVIARYLERETYQVSIANTRFVASYALIAACDIKPDQPQSSSVDITYLEGVKRILSSQTQDNTPKTVHICSDALTLFSETVLPQVKQDFILLSGDSDLSISSASLGGAFVRILKHPKLLAWYAQNKDEEHSKLHSLPIGLDFHSKWVDPRMWGDGMILPAMQELDLRLTLSNAPRWEDRIPKAYCDWVNHLKRGDRMECREKVGDGTCFYISNPLDRNQTWREQSRYAFVLSPSGEGFDCHRTWEALALGCVPIVKRHPLCDLFSELPVVLVDDWSEITETFLREWHIKLQSQEFNYSKLMLGYWKSKIHCLNESSTPLKKMTMAQFSEFICA